jgi:predicted DNA-binding transcriptional regulator AlpA
MATTTDKFLSFDELRAEFGLSSTSQRYMLRLERAGGFPARIHLGTRRVAWSRAEVVAWIDAKKAARHN